MLPWGRYRWQSFRLYPALPFSRAWQTTKVFPVSHPNLAFLYQIDFIQLVLVPIMHEILATERYTNNNKKIYPMCASRRYQIENTEMWNTRI
jgi:hypothetical protein